MLVFLANNATTNDPTKELPGLDALAAVIPHDVRGLLERWAANAEALKFDALPDEPKGPA